MPISEDKVKATFYLSRRIVNLLETVWLDLRPLAPPEHRKQINKSTIVEAALEIVLLEYQERGDKSELYYRTVRKFKD